MHAWIARSGADGDIHSRVILRRHLSGRVRESGRALALDGEILERRPCDRLRPRLPLAHWFALPERGFAVSAGCEPF